jgi:nucleoside-diphosphate-sugar epimerase
MLLKKILVLGAGGFIGSHLVRELKRRGNYVVGADLKYPEFSPTVADMFIQGDLRDPTLVKEIFKTHYNEVYQLAADMGGAGYVFTGDNDADILYNSALININVVDSIKNQKDCQLFYSSSACMYPEYRQLKVGNMKLAESMAYPAEPDSEYGWEKLFSERLYLNFSKNYGIKVKIARYHNIFGPNGTWQGGKEKAPAAICRKVAHANNNSEIEIWGSGEQTRSFLYVDECVEATLALMSSDFNGPVNIGSEELVSINELAQKIIRISGKTLTLKHIPGPVGVNGRNSDNTLFDHTVGRAYTMTLDQGLERTYHWINKQVNG